MLLLRDSFTSSPASEVTDALWHDSMIYRFWRCFPTGHCRWLDCAETGQWVTGQVRPQHELLSCSSRHQTGKIPPRDAEHVGLYILGTLIQDRVADFGPSSDPELEELGEEVAPCLGRAGGLHPGEPPLACMGRGKSSPSKGARSTFASQP